MSPNTPQIGSTCSQDARLPSKTFRCSKSLSRELLTGQILKVPRFPARDSTDQEWSEYHVQARTNSGIERALNHHSIGSQRSKSSGGACSTVGARQLPHVLEAIAGRKSFCGIPSTAAKLTVRALHARGFTGVMELKVIVETVHGTLEMTQELVVALEVGFSPS
ncbi:hypothetical protein B0H17DRAFT_1186196 [Mycena rosella]|uniref:Uncharacterized protein n=1 Tax=Mycena rosella TaxID=1033263 RepID=A0AAD7CN80_MYCRO|nr:hypothetical protein B0H17DRAFT_1186196 [Mycena rosella]